MNTVLTPCEGEHIPFDWSVNPYRGCAFACRYCYARYTHEWLGKDADGGFDREILLKEDIDRVLARDLARLRNRGVRAGAAPARRGDDYYPHLNQVAAADQECIAIGTATDPYQPLEHKYGLTRACLQTFLREPSAHVDGYDLSVTTKSDLVVRDIPLLQELGQSNHVTINMTLTTLDTDLARALECGAPTPQARLQALQALVAAGIDVCVFVSPILPAITDDNESLELLFEALGKIGVRRVVCEALFLRSPTKEIFMRFLTERFPELAADYERRYASSVYASPLYVERLRARVERLRDRYGLLGRRPSHQQALGGADEGQRRKGLPKGALPRGDGLQQLYLFD